MRKGSSRMGLAARRLRWCAAVWVRFWDSSDGPGASERELTNCTNSWMRNGSSKTGSAARRSRWCAAVRVKFGDSSDGPRASERELTNFTNSWMRNGSSKAGSAARRSRWCAALWVKFLYSSDGPGASEREVTNCTNSWMRNGRSNAGFAARRGRDGGVEAASVLETVSAVFASRVARGMLSVLSGTLAHGLFPDCSGVEPWVVLRLVWLTAMLKRSWISRAMKWLVLKY